MVFVKHQSTVLLAEGAGHCPKILGTCYRRIKWILGGGGVWFESLVSVLVLIKLNLHSRQFLIFAELIF